MRLVCGFVLLVFPLFAQIDGRVTGSVVDTSGAGIPNAEVGLVLAGGKQPLTLESGETRTFLADGDRLILRGWCEKAGHPRIGFGEVSGTVLPTQNA